MKNKCYGYDYILLNQEHYERQTDTIVYAFLDKKDALSVMRRLVAECVSREDPARDNVKMEWNDEDYCEVRHNEDLWYTYQIYKAPRRINDNFVSVDEIEDFTDITRKETKK